VTGGARPGSAVTSIDACRYLTAVDVGSGTRVPRLCPMSGCGGDWGGAVHMTSMEAMLRPPRVDLLSWHLRRRAQASPWLPALDPAWPLRRARHGLAVSGR
jgi:hypothetical protein